MMVSPSPSTALDSLSESTLSKMAGSGGPTGSIVSSSGAVVVQPTHTTSILPISAMVHSCLESLPFVTGVHQQQSHQETVFKTESLEMLPPQPVHSSLLSTGQADMRFQFVQGIFPSFPSQASLGGQEQSNNGSSNIFATTALVTTNVSSSDHVPFSVVDCCSTFLSPQQDTPDPQQQQQMTTTMTEVGVVGTFVQSSSSLSSSSLSSSSLVPSSSSVSSSMKASHSSELDNKGNVVVIGEEGMQQPLTSSQSSGSEQPTQQTLQSINVMSQMTDTELLGLINPSTFEQVL